MATSFLLAQTGTTPFIYIWSEVDGTFVNRGTINPAILGGNGAQTKAWYSATSRYLIVFLASYSGFQAFEVDPNTGKPLSTTPDFSFNNDFNFLGSIAYVSVSADRRRMVINTGSANRKAAVVTFTEGSGFAVEAEITFPGSTGVYPFFRFPKNSNDTILGIDKDAATAASPNTYVVKFKRTGTSWGTAQSQDLPGTSAGQQKSFDAVQTPDGKIRMVWYGGTSGRFYAEFTHDSSTPLTSGQRGNAAGTFPTRAVFFTADGQGILFSESSTSADSSSMADWPFTEAIPLNNWGVGNTRSQYAQLTASSPRDVKLGLGTSSRGVMGRLAVAAVPADARMVAISAWGPPSITSVLLPGTNANAAPTNVDWSPDTVVSRDVYLDADFPAMVGSFAGLQQRAYLAGQLPTATGSFTSRFRTTSDMEAYLPAMTASFEGFPTTAAFVASEFPAIRANFNLALLQVEQLPGAEVHIREEWARVFGEAPIAEFSYPHFGYFDGAGLPALIANFEAGTSYEVSLAATLPSLKANIAARFPIETNFTGTFPTVGGSFEGIVDNTRNVELDATLPALRGAIFAWQDVEGVVTGTLPSLTGAMSAFQVWEASFSGTFGALTADMQGEVVFALRLPGVLPKMTAAFELFTDNEDQYALAADFPKLVGDITVFQTIESDVVGELPSLTSEFEVWVPITGDMAGTLPMLVSDIELKTPEPYFLAGVLPSLTSEIEVWQDIAVFEIGTLPALTGDMMAVYTYGVTMSAILPGLTSDIEMWVPIFGDVAASLPALTSDITGQVVNPARMIGNLPAIGGDFLAGFDYVVTMPAMLPGLTSDIEVWMPILGDVAASLPAMTGDLLGYQTKVGLLGGTLPGLRGLIEVFIPDLYFLAGTLPALKAEIYAGPPTMIDMNGRFPALIANFRAGTPVKITMAAVLPGLNAHLVAAQPYTIIIEGLLPSMTASIEVEGLPAEQGLEPVNFDFIGTDGDTVSGFSLSGNVIFGFGTKFP